MLKQCLGLCDMCYRIITALYTVGLNPLRPISTGLSLNEAIFNLYRLKELKKQKVEE